jgi:hypothetical protein
VNAAGSVMFSQVMLSAAQLRAGIMQRVDGVHIPSEPMAMTSLRATDLERLVGITFQETFDDLDRGRFAVLEFAASFAVLLNDYAGSPTEGTRICTDEMGQHSMSRLESILSALKLSPDQLIWTVHGLI